MSRKQLIEVAEGIAFLRRLWRRHPLPMQLFLLLSLNLVIAPAVFGAAGGQLERGQAYAIGILGFVTLGLSIYLFVVILQPERF